MLIPITMILLFTILIGCSLVLVALTKTWQLKIFNNICLYKVGACLFCGCCLLVLCMTGAIGFNLIAGQQLC